MKSQLKYIVAAISAFAILQSLGFANAQPVGRPKIWPPQGPTATTPTTTTGQTLTLPNGVVVSVSQTATPFVRPITVPTDTAIGEGACCCPMWEGKIGDSITPVFPNGSNAPYSVSIGVGNLDDQMKAYLAYINSVEPTITQISIGWTAINLGTAATHAASGPIVTGTLPQSMSWSINSGVVASNIPSFWTGTPFNVGTWYGYITTISHNGNQTTPFMKPECATNFKPYRWGGVFKIANGQNTPTGEVQLETTGANGAVVKSAPIAVAPGRSIRMRDLRPQPRN